MQVPGGLEGVTGRVHRDAYEQNEQHQKHMEEILQFMSQWKLTAINTYPLEEAWTQLKADEERQEQGQEREGAARRHMDYCVVAPSLQAAASVHPRRLFCRITSR